MKKRILAFMLAVVLCFSCLPFAAFAEREYDVECENIGIGGGGQLLKTVIDPTNPDNYYAVCDMGGLYCTKNRGQSWSRTETDGYINDLFIADNGELFLGGYGLFKSTDGGKNLQRIYPKAYQFDVRRHGWNERLYRANNLIDGFDFDNGYLLCVAVYENNVYFATCDYLGNVIYFRCDRNGDELEIISREQANGSGQTLNFNVSADENGAYFSNSKQVLFYDNTAKEMTSLYTADGVIRDIEKIGDSFYILDNVSNETKIIKTNDFLTYSALPVDKSLPNSFYQYGQTKQFEWRFERIVGNNSSSIYLAFHDKNVRNAAGVLKYNGNDFEWVFDGMDNDRTALGVTGWSFGAIYPIGGICCDANDDSHVLMTCDTVYDIHYNSKQDRSVLTTHCTEYADGSSETKGLDVLTTYSVKEDPFNPQHIIICSTDVGLQNSYNGGKSFKRMKIQAEKDEEYARYNTCYDLYFDTQTEGKVYGLWSSIHDVPYYPTRIDKKDARGYLALSTDGGETWDFTYSSLPENSIPCKMSVQKNGDELTIAVATFNNGFFISYDSGKTFESINDGMDVFRTSISGYEQDTADYIFGEDVVIAGNTVYCLTCYYTNNNSVNVPSKLYAYDIETKQLSSVDLGNDILIARSLTYNEERGLFLSVLPQNKSEWKVEEDTWFWFNFGGGIYEIKNNQASLLYEVKDGVYSCAFSPTGTMYASGVYGDVYIEDGGKLSLYKTGLFRQQKGLSFSSDGEKLYVMNFGGGVNKLNTLRHCVTFVNADGSVIEKQKVYDKKAAVAPSNVSHPNDSSMVFSSWNGDFSAITSDTVIVAEFVKKEQPTEPTNPTNPTEPTEPTKPTEPDSSCSCLCHKTGFMGFVYKIARFFWKLFGINKACQCGNLHY